MEPMEPTADDIASMAMTLNTYYDNWIIFKGFETKTGGMWFAAIVFIAFLAFLSETAGYILSKYEGKLSIPFYCMLKTISYVQMLIVMTYNIQIIFTLIICQTAAHFFFLKKNPLRIQKE